MCSSITHLISIEFTFALLLFSLLLEGQDNQSHKNVQKEEREHDNKEDIVKRDLYLVVNNWAVVNFRCIDGGLHETVE